MGPIFLTCWSWLLKSSSVNRDSIRRWAVRSASSRSTFSWARSTRVTMSPMPRIRCARRSGWKTSSASTFSPVPM